MSPNQRIIGIIEDDDSVRRALGRLLRSAGFDVATFVSAEEFLQAQAAPDCLVLYVHLPGMNGLDALPVEFAPRRAPVLQSSS